MGFDLAFATRIYGSSMAAWHQNGRYFDHEGKEIPPEQAAMPNPEDPPVVNPPPEVDTVPQYLDGPAAREDKPVPLVAAPSPATRLRKMPAAEVAELVTLAGGTPESGVGAKKRNMEWLLEHTR